MNRQVEEEQTTTPRSSRRHIYSRVLLVACVVLALVAGCVTADAYEWSDGFAPAAVDDYEIITPMCWEPDIVNTTDEIRDFSVQASLGNGELSKVHVMESVPPGQRMHLHLFQYAWENNLLEELAATAEVRGCELIIRTRLTGTG